MADDPGTDKRYSTVIIKYQINSSSESSLTICHPSIEHPQLHISVNYESYVESLFASETWIERLPKF